jgi:hypothetical protein
MFQGGQPGGLPGGPNNQFRFAQISTANSKAVNAASKKEDKLVDEESLESKLNRGEIKNPTLNLENLQGLEMAQELQFSAIMAEYDNSEDAKRANQAHEELENLGISNNRALILPLTEKIMTTQVIIVPEGTKAH